MEPTDSWSPSCPVSMSASQFRVKRLLHSDEKGIEVHVHYDVRCATSKAPSRIRWLKFTTRDPEAHLAEPNSGSVPISLHSLVSSAFIEVPNPPSVELVQID